MSFTVGERRICEGSVTEHKALASVDTSRITGALQGRDEGRASGRPNPGSSMFHVLQLPTMLRKISRQSLSANLKPVVLD